MNVTLKNSTYTSLAGEKSQCSMTTPKSLLLTGYLILLFTGTIGNGLVLIIFRKYWRTGSLLELMILYLALFDFFSSIFTPCLFGYWIITCNSWFLGYVACKILPPMVRILSNLSFAFLMLMAVDRCMAIVRPFKERITRKAVHKFAFMAVVFSTAWETQYIYCLEIKDGICSTHAYHKDKEIIVEILLLITRDFTFIFVMSFSTILAYVVLQKNVAKNKGCKGSCGDGNSSKQVIVMLIWMGVVSCVTILPRDIFHLSYYMYAMFSTPFLHKEETLSINSFFKLLQASNSVYNVFIYAGKHNRFYKDVQYTFCRKRKHLLSTTLTTENCEMKLLMNHSNSGRMNEVKLTSVRTP